MTTVRVDGGPVVSRAVQELRALVDGYAVAADEGDGDAFAALFTDDGLLVVAGVDGLERSRYVGAAELATVPAKLARYDLTMHLVPTHRVTVVDDGTATGVAYCEAHHRRGGTDSILYIRYDDTYLRAGDGGWRIATRHVRTLFEERRGSE